MMYDELIKWLWECASGECFNCSHKGNASCPDDLMKQAADAIEKLWELFQSAEKDNAKLTAWYVEKCNKHKWIPVTERLPETLDYVLCCGAKGRYVCWLYRRFYRIARFRLGMATWW